MHIYIYMQICTCLMKGPGSSNIPMATDTPSAQILALIPFSTKNNQRSLKK